MKIRLSILNLFRLVSILVYLKPIRPFTVTATEQGTSSYKAIRNFIFISSRDFSERIRDLDGNGLIPGTISNHRALFLGEKPGEVLMSSLSVVSALFTIWIFAETRNKQNGKIFDGLVEDIVLQLENLNFRMEEIKNSQLQLICLFNVVQAQTRNKGVSRECLQFSKERQQVAASHFGKTIPLRNQ